VRRVDDEGSGSKRFILATADKGLARIASALFHYKDEHDDAGSLSQRLEAWWSQADARTIANKFMTTVERLDESTRQTNTCRSSDYIQSLVLAGERYLLESR
jgi:hypothetical protein